MQAPYLIGAAVSILIGIIAYPLRRRRSSNRCALWYDNDGKKICVRNRCGGWRCRK
jgi:hypothetical protein